MIKGTNISWSYQKKKGVSPILKNVSFELKKGRITTFMGQSGAGKTTLLKCMANLNTAYEGSIMADEKDVKTLNSVDRATTVGFVFQQFHLFPHLTVLKNCTHALVSAMGVKELDAEVKAVEVLDTLGMGSYMHSFPSQLSGGQQQRVAIARALVLQPEVLLLDEPTSALDPESKKSLETLLLEINAGGITIGLSSHDMPFIRKIMDVVYFMEQGEIVEEWDKMEGLISSKEKINRFLHHH